jgi:ribonucleoside-diphosphate reductase beta chain
MIEPIDIAICNPKDLIGDGRIGLLDATGTYDVDRYPWAYEFWKRQQQTHWMGEEVPLGADIKDWASSRVTAPERNLLTQISASSPSPTSRSATTTSSATSRSSSRWKCR